MLPFAALDDDESPETAAFARWCRELTAGGSTSATGPTERWPSRACTRALAAAPGLRDRPGFDRLTPLQELLLQRWAAGRTGKCSASGKHPGRAGHVLGRKANALLGIRCVPEIDGSGSTLGQPGVCTASMSAALPLSCRTWRVVATRCAGSSSAS